MFEKSIVQEEIKNVVLGKTKLQILSDSRRNEDLLLFVSLFYQFNYLLILCRKLKKVNSFGKFVNLNV
jgi:hypothetical protein